MFLIEACACQQALEISISNSWRPFYRTEGRECRVGWKVLRFLRDCIMINFLEIAYCSLKWYCGIFNKIILIHSNSLNVSATASWMWIWIWVCCCSSFLRRLASRRSSAAASREDLVSSKQRTSKFKDPSRWQSWKSYCADDDWRC